jgi:protein-S-isoprenylcysteine O-methyltransferase Ste14
MSTLVIVLRIVALASFAAPMLLGDPVRRAQSAAQTHPSVRDRAPLAANFTAFGLFLLSLVIVSSTSQGSTALALALSGCIVALSGAALVLRSRAELGSAWSLLPKAHADTGLVTTGPYRSVRHPIYLGLTLLATGNALAFGSWPALLVVSCGIFPTFVWRARREEIYLNCTFGERFAVYRQRTRMIIPYLL